MTLSPRELEVVAQLRLGHPNKIIAHSLGISEMTVKLHVYRIMQKLNARNRWQAVLIHQTQEMQSCPPPLP